jgi:hypothetical protein
MSATIVLSLFPEKELDERCAKLAAFGNGWGSGPFLWEQMAKRYLEPGKTWMTNGPELWGSLDRPDMPNHHRAVMLMTFRLATIQRQDYLRAADDIREWLDDLPLCTPQNLVNNWPKIADLFESEPDCPAIGFVLSTSEDNLFEYANSWDKVWSVYERLDRLFPER